MSIAASFAWSSAVETDLGRDAGVVGVARVVQSRATVAVAFIRATKAWGVGDTIDASMSA